MRRTATTTGRTWVLTGAFAVAAAFAGTAAGITSPQQLLNAPVPSACEHPAGTLVNGSLPGIPQGQGSVELVRNQVVLGEVVPGGGVGAVAVLRCDQGGVGWPSVLVFYDANLRVLASVDLLKVTHGGREFVRTLRMSGRTVRADVVNIGQRDDAACCGTRSATLRMHYDADAGRVLVTRVQVYDDRTAAAALVRALRRGAVREARRWASPNAVATLMGATTTASRRTMALGACYGVLDLSGHGTFLGSAERGCRVSVRAGGRRLVFGLRMQRQAWNRWRAASVVTIAR